MRRHGSDQYVARRGTVIFDGSYTEPAPRKPKPGRTFLAALIILLVIAGVSVGIVKILDFVNSRDAAPSIPEQCQAVVGTNQVVSVDLDQAHNAAIIAGVSIQRGMIPRAASIGLATAYQESSLHNINYGDRDSLGLFQQRPSQGWGTPEQVTDPWYASNRFYQELVKFRGWETGDINDYAQKVQRSGVPDGYRKHEINARSLASALTGETPASFTCLIRSVPSPNPDELVNFLSRVFSDSIEISRVDGEVRVNVSNDTTGWAVAATGMATTNLSGITEVQFGKKQWTNDTMKVAPWREVGSDTGHTVVFRFQNQS